MNGWRFFHSRKIWLRATVIGLIFGVGVLVLASQRFSPERITAQAVAVIQGKTGFTVSVSGPFRRTFLPWFGFHTGPIKIDNSKNPGSSPQLNLTSLTARIRLLPLLFGDIKLDQIILQNPRLFLLQQVDKTDLSGQQLDKKSSKTQGAAFLQDLSIAGLTIRNGSVIIKNPQSDMAFGLHRISLQTGAIQSLKSFPFKLVGSLVDSSRKLNADMDLHGDLRLDFLLGHAVFSDVIIKAGVDGGAIPQTFGQLQILTTLDFSHHTGHLLARQFSLKTDGVAISGRFSGEKLFTNPKINTTIQATVAEHKFPGLPIKNVQADIRMAEGTATATLKIAGPDSQQFRSDVLMVQDDLGSRTLTIGGEAWGIDSATISGVPAPLLGKIHSRFAIDSTGSGVGELLQDINLSIKASIPGKIHNKIPKNLHLNAVLGYSPDRGDLSLQQARLTIANNSMRFGTDVTGVGSDLWQAKGYLDAKQLNINTFYHLLGQPVPAISTPDILKSTDIRLGFVTSEHGTIIDKLKLEIAGSTIKGRGVMLRHNRPNLKFAVWTDRLDIDQFFPPAREEKIVVKEDDKPLLLNLDAVKDSRWSASISIDKLLVKGLIFKKVKLQSDSKDGKSASLSLTGNLFSGDITGKITGITKTKKNPKPQFSLRFRMKDGQVGPFLTAAAGKPFLTGNLQIFSDLYGEGLDTAELLKSLRGRCGITIANGYINQFKSEDEYTGASQEKNRVIPFKKIFGHFQVRQGVFHTNYLNIKGPELTANGRGQLDLPAGNIDISIQTAYNEILKIPVTIKGKLSEPKVAVNMEDMVVDTTDSVLDLPWIILDRLLAQEPD
jgi:uncharacterized protein involved in outer membrane biogenesis